MVLYTRRIRNLFWWFFVIIKIDLIILLAYTSFAFLFGDIILSYKLLIFFLGLGLFIPSMFIIGKRISSDFLYSFKIISLHHTIIILLIGLSGYLIGLISVNFIFKALLINVPFIKIAFYLPLVALISSIPISFLGFGTRESAMILFFSEYAPTESLLSAGILLSVVVVVVPSLISAVFINKFLKNLFDDSNIHNDNAK